MTSSGCSTSSRSGRRHFRETFRDVPSDESRLETRRAALTAIYFPRAPGERSHWHRIDAVEVWHWHAGAPLELETAPERGGSERLRLGGNLAADERLQAPVPTLVWQAA
jgi:predicted cupin superfamily sugar epimerase